MGGSGWTPVAAPRLGPGLIISTPNDLDTNDLDTNDLDTNDLDTEDLDGENMTSANDRAIVTALGDRSHLPVSSGVPSGDPSGNTVFHDDTFHDDTFGPGLVLTEAAA